MFSPRRKGNVKTRFHMEVFVVGFMRDQFYKAKDDKFRLLFSVKPELNPVIDCMFHPSEGCDVCEYIQRCGIREGGVV